MHDFSLSDLHTFDLQDHHVQKFITLKHDEIKNLKKYA